MTGWHTLVIGDASGLDALGRWLGGLSYKRQAVFLRSAESARTAADVLERRTERYPHRIEAGCAAFTQWWG